MKDKLILSFYIDIRSVDEQNVQEYINQIKEVMHNQMDAEGNEGVMAFFIPVKSDSRVECVNPVLVMEEEAIANFNKAMENLQNTNIQFQKQISKKNEKA